MLGANYGTPPDRAEMARSGDDGKAPVRVSW
jgi:hypothetical protein